MTVIKDITKYAVERGIDKIKPSNLDYIANIFEELVELEGYDVPKVNRVILKSYLTDFINKLCVTEVINKLDEHDTEYNEVDAQSDIIIFTVTELLKRGYDPEKVLIETVKEVSSRTGSIVNGKFEKDLSEEAVSKHYKADYTECKVDTV